MKIARLPATPALASFEAGEVLPHPAPPSVCQVGPIEGRLSDRERSLRQELDAIEAAAVGPFAGEGHILADTRALAAALVACPHPEELLRGNLSLPTGVDERA